MIDFRYHLVSLVSVFIALAVGVVLGAGPLKDPINNQLNTRVNQLAEENRALQDQVSSLRAAVDHRDSFSSTVEPALVAGRLTGRSVVVVTLPDAEGDTVSSVTRALRDSGAAVAGRVDLTDAWSDPARADDRRGALSSATSASSAASSGPTSADGVDSTQLSLANELASTLGTTDSASVQSVPRPAAAQAAVLSALRSAGLVTVNGTSPGPAQLAVLVAPPVAAARAGATPSPSASGAPDTSPLWRAVAAALDAASLGVVVLGPESSAASGGVVGSVRGSQVSQQVSTVDQGGSPAGDVETVFALVEQVDGGSGAYGFGIGARSALPDGVPAAAR